MRKWILKGTTLKHHFTLHYFEWNSDHIALFLGSNFCYARDKNRLILGNIEDWNVFVNLIKEFNVLLVWFPAGKGLKKVDFSTFLKLDKISYDS